MNKVYVDSSCLIEFLKGESRAQDPSESLAVKRILKAGRDEKLHVYTSVLTIAEVLRGKNNPPNRTDKEMIDEFLLSGRNGIKLIQATPDIVVFARNLAWDYDVSERAMDRLHLASSASMEIKELLTTDQKFIKNVSRSKFEGCVLVRAQECTLIPPGY